MNDDIDPIYDFASLKDFLNKRGFIVGQAQGYKPITPEVINPMDEIRRGTMEFRDDGIFVINPETGAEQQVYVYKYDYWLHRYGESIPKFHICRCSTISDFMMRGAFDGHYVRANTDPVPVLSKESHEIEEVSNMPLCQNCQSRIREYGRITSSEFVEILHEAMGLDEMEQPEELEVDIFGYTRDWEAISKQYREKQNYTCERCGLKIDDTYDRQYIHVHHINGDKLNNKEENLKCLCLYCHSHVDWVHKRRLTYGANGIIYRNFMDKYSDDIPDEFKDEVEDDDEELIEVGQD